MKSLIRRSKECAFTGHCHDHLLSDALTDWNQTKPLSLWAISGRLQRVALESVHKKTEYEYSDEGLTENLSANEYYFNEDGSIHE